MTTALERGEGLASRHARFTPGKDPVPIVQEAGWAPGRSGQVRKMSPQPGFDSPDRPARSQSLYRTELPGPHLREHSSYIFSFFSNYYRSAWYYQIFFIYQLMHKRIAIKIILKFTLKQLRHVSV